jgi:hypothetical protein
MTGQNYVEFLQNELPEQLDDVPLAARIATRLLMQYLNDTFLNRWIGRGSTINWPPRSPDVTPFDFCLWGWMKSKVYRRKVDIWDELLDRKWMLLPA